nr:reverse transcriptase domain-containing protein [Tanacetum cinerariifolium]
MVKEKQAVNNDFYHEPFIFKESEKDMHDLVASLFTKRIRDYDMPDGIEAPTNLRAYNGTTDLDDHLTVFMGTIDVHKLPKPAWCRFFHITLSGKAKFCKETLHMVDRSDVVVSGAFISGLRSGRLFKDLIAKSSARHLDNYKVPNDTFTSLIKSPTETLATSDGKAMLFLSPRMFATANRKDQMNYYEFHEDHGHDTNNCIDLQKEIEACVRKGPMAYLAKGAKSNDNCQANQPAPLPYNVILRLSRLTKLCAIASTLHSLMKFRTEEGIAIVSGEKLQTNICNQISQKRDYPEDARGIDGVEHIVVNDEHSVQTLAIATNLPKLLKEKIRELLCFNQDIFAWTPADMTGILRELAKHKLNIHP